MMQSVKPRLAEAARRPGARLIWAAAAGLAMLALATFYVSFRAQYAFMYAVKHQDLPALIEALIADVASVRSVAVYVMPPAVFAVCTDQVVSVVRRFGLGISEDSAWAVLGRSVVAAARLAGIIVLYSLRLVLAPAKTAGGLRKMVLAAAPIPQPGPRQAAPGAFPGTAPKTVLEVLPRPVLEAVPDVPERPQGKQPGPATPERLAEFYAADLAAGRVPSKRQIKRE